jgi:hypothetical protein
LNFKYYIYTEIVIEERCVICPACRARVHRGSNFCSNCGSPVENTGAGPNLLVQYVHSKHTVSVKKYKDYMDLIEKVTGEMKDFESGEEGFLSPPACLPGLQQEPPQRRDT